jgi:hypothetical protein
MVTHRRFKSRLRSEALYVNTTGLSNTATGLLRSFQGSDQANVSGLQSHD